jgi:hypothetical protein
MCCLLGYLVLKPTDSDLRRSYNRIADHLDLIDQSLADLKEPLTQLREYKRRTFMLDKDFDIWRSKARELRITLSVASHNIENLSPDTRTAAETMLADLEKKKDKLASSINNFSNLVTTLHEFVVTSFPLLSTMKNYQVRFNRVAEVKEKAGVPLDEDMLKQIDNYNVQCEQIQSMANETLSTIHSNLEQGKILANTTMNQLKKLLPTLEAFLEDLEG